MSKVDFVPFADKMIEGDWRVEAVNADAKEVYIAIFSGPDCERLAHEYAAFKNGKHPAVGILQPAVLVTSAVQDTLQLNLKNGDQILVRPNDMVWEFNPRLKGSIVGSPKPAIERLGVIKKGKS
jgi:hypothetical protein